MMSATSGVACQIRCRITNATTTGHFFVITPTTATAAPFDLIALGSSPADTAETNILTANVPIPVMLEIATKQGVNEDTLVVEFQAETGTNTITIHAGSYYIKC